MSLDLEAEDFDPVAALASTSITLPCPDVQPLGNLAEYVNATNQVPKLREKAASVSKKLQRVNVFKEHCPRKRLKNVLTIMEDIQGPLGRLRDCMKEHTTVKVFIRRAAEMRGVCTGYILAFDHHWNLIMSDVDETYALMPKKIKTVPQCESAVAAALQQSDSKNSCAQDAEKSPLEASEIGQKQERVADRLSEEISIQETKPKEETAMKIAPESMIRHKPPKMEIRRRHVHQLFIRGDNVAFISIP